MQFGRIGYAGTVGIAVIVFKPPPKTRIAAFDHPPRNRGVGMIGIGVTLFIRYAVLDCGGEERAEISARIFARQRTFIELRPHIIRIFAPCAFGNIHHMPEFVRHAPSEIFGAQAGHFPVAVRIDADVFPIRIRRRAGKRLHHTDIYVQILRARIGMAFIIYAAEVIQGGKIFLPVCKRARGGITARCVLCMCLRCGHGQNNVVAGYFRHVRQTVRFLSDGSEIVFKIGKIFPFALPRPVNGERISALDIHFDPIALLRLRVRIDDI